MSSLFTATEGHKAKRGQVDSERAPHLQKNVRRLAGETKNSEDTIFARTQRMNALRKREEIDHDSSLYAMVSHWVLSINLTC